MSTAESAASALPILASGLDSPIKFTLTGKRNLLVSEHKAAGPGMFSVRDRNVTPTEQPPPNSGRISIIKRDGKRGCTILDGLPASVMTAIPHEKTIWIQIGAWDLVLPGPIPGTEIPNPHPSSPILASVLVMHLPAECDDLQSGFTITLDDHGKLAKKTELKLKNSHGQHATLRLLTKMTSFTPAPVPGAPNAVRGSNPFGMVETGGTLYLSDAAQNTVVKVDSKTGSTATLLTFPQMTNPGGTPPTMDAVPDSIRIHHHHLLVPLLSGFPFPAGRAEIRAVGFEGTNSSFIAGLTSAIDVLPVKTHSGKEVFFVLEFSLNQNANAPGRLLRYDAPEGPPVTVADKLISPTNLVYDEHERRLYLTEIFPGNIRTLQVH